MDSCQVALPNRNIVRLEGPCRLTGVGFAPMGIVSVWEL